jgi:2-dehydropantoate 2-reductase
MRHGILGPGGVGGLIAAVLADAGEDVMLIVRPGTESLYPREISLESPFGGLRAAESIAASPPKQLDLLWVTVKATQLAAALETISKTLSVNAVVPLLNGIDHVALLRGRFGDEAVMPATIAVESERTAPGKIVHRSPFIRLGSNRARQQIASRDCCRVRSDENDVATHPKRCSAGFSRMRRMKVRLTARIQFRAR